MNKVLIFHRNVSLFQIHVRINLNFDKIGLSYAKMCFILRIFSEFMFAQKLGASKQIIRPRQGGSMREK